MVFSTALLLFVFVLFPWNHVKGLFAEGDGPKETGELKTVDIIQEPEIVEEPWEIRSDDADDREYEEEVPEIEFTLHGNHRPYKGKVIWDPLSIDSDKMDTQNKSTPKISDTQMSDSTDTGCNICGVGGHKSAILSESKLSKVISGVAVRPLNKYPFVVPIQNKGSTLLKCGGAVISKWFILTAAHCLKSKAQGDFVEQNPSELTVGIMKTNPTVPDTNLEVSKIIIYPEYDDDINDIALIKLKEPLRCDKYTRPICLPQKKMDRMGGTVIIAGYGRTDHTTGVKAYEQRLREGRVKQVDSAVCQNATSNQKDKDKIFCTVGIGPFTSCEGDSGSSVFGDFDGVFYSLGVTSVHVNASYCPVDGPVTFTNSFAYLDWIKSNVEDLPSPPKSFV